MREHSRAKLWLLVIISGAFYAALLFVVANNYVDQLNFKSRFDEAISLALIDLANDVHVIASARERGWAQYPKASVAIGLKKHLKHRDIAKLSTCVCSLQASAESIGDQILVTLKYNLKMQTCEGSLNFFGATDAKRSIGIYAPT
jgi:hypothetical protein